MNLSKLVRIQLSAFATVALLATTFSSVYYLRIPATLGIGRYEVTVELPRAGGLYESANVTDNGLTIGRVTAVNLTPSGVTATLSLIDSVHVPRDLTARVRSMSAIGEQYVDLQPAVDHGPFLHNGDTIGVDRVHVPDEIGPILDRTRQILATLSPDALHTIVDQSGRGFSGAGTDLATLLDSTITFVQMFAANGGATKNLIEQLQPLLDTQVVSSTDIRTWAANLAALTEQLRIADPAVRSILQSGPAAADQADTLFQNLAPTLPVLLAGLTTVGQVALTYNPAIEQILVLLPPMIAAQNTAGARGAPYGGVNVDFSVELQDPAACTTGFLPADQRRDPSDESVPDTPSNLFCNVPHDSPFAVRGAHNLPCLNNPGVRAATPADCLAGGTTPAGDNGPNDGTGDPGNAAPASGPARFLPGGETYMTPDGNTYRHIDIGPASDQHDPQEQAWQSLWTAPIA